MKKNKEYIQKQMFFPGILGIFVNPFYFARKGLVDEIMKIAGSIGGKVLDIGCGSKPYASLYSCEKYIGLELDTEENRANKKADYFYDGKKIPFEDEEFDSIIANEVFEHVFNPDEFLDEVVRVLKVGGKLLLTVPFVWDEHEQPYDYARYSSFGLEYLLKKHGFQIIDSKKSMNDIRTSFQLINSYLYKKLKTKNKYIDFFSTIIFIAPFNLIGQLLSFITPKNDDLYLDNIILAEKVEQ